MLNHGASLHFVLLLALRTLEAMFQAKNNVGSTPASTALAQVLHRSHNSHTANCHVRGSVERNGAQRRTKVSFSKPWFKYWSYSGWQKGTSTDKAMLNSARIKPTALAIIELCLSEGISE